MPTPREFQQISRTRLEEVKLLFNNGYYDGAIYLSGYVIEAALKARVCRVLDGDYPEAFVSFKTHDFDDLIKLAGLKREFDDDTANNVILKKHASIFTQSQKDKQKLKPLRYYPIGSHSKADAQKVITAIQNRNHGILKWIKARW